MVFKKRCKNQMTFMKSLSGRYAEILDVTTANLRQMCLLS